MFIFSSRRKVKIDKKRELFFTSKLTGFYDWAVVTRPLPRNGGMAEDRQAPGAWKLSRAWWTTGRIETERRQSFAKNP